MGLINEHDITKKMMAAMKDGSVSKALTENQVAEPSVDKDAKSGLDLDKELQGTGVTTSDDDDSGIDLDKELQGTGVETSADDVIQLTGEEKKDEEKKFREVMGNLVEFGEFNIYPKAGNVIFGGTFQGMDGLQFQFTLEDSNGLYVTANNMQVTSEVVETVQKLKGYYDNWKEEWANKIATEYNK